VQMRIIERKSSFTIPQPHLFSSQAPVPGAAYPSLCGSHHGGAFGSKYINAFMAPSSSIPGCAPKALDSLISFGSNREMVHGGRFNFYMKGGIRIDFRLYHDLIDPRTAD